MQQPGNTHILQVRESSSLYSMTRRWAPFSGTALFVSMFRMQLRASCWPQHSMCSAFLIEPHFAHLPTPSFSSPWFLLSILVPCPHLNPGAPVELGITGMWPPRPWVLFSSWRGASREGGRDALRRGDQGRAGSRQPPQPVQGELLRKPGPRMTRGKLSKACAALWLFQHRLCVEASELN